MNLNILPTRMNQRILNRKGVMPLPRKLIFEPTLMCNLKCSMCERYQNYSKKNKNELGLSEIRRFIEKLPKSIRSVYISGGEPFMREDIIDICKSFSKKGMLVYIQTNGTFVESTLKLAKIRNVRMLFSLDGPPNIHNMIRGQSFVYERTMSILRVLKYDLKKDFVITSVITDENLTFLKDFIEKLKKEHLKPNWLIIELARRYTKDIMNETLNILKLNPRDLSLHIKDDILPSYSYKKFKKYMLELDKKLKKNRFKFTYYPINLFDKLEEFYYRSYRRNNELYCTHLNELRIDSQGNIIPCFTIRKNFGNVTADSLEDIWNSKEYCIFRTNLIKNNLAPICETCYRAVDHSFYKKLFSIYAKRIISDILDGSFYKRLSLYKLVPRNISI